MNMVEYSLCKCSIANQYKPFPSISQRSEKTSTTKLSNHQNHSKPPIVDASRVKPHLSLSNIHFLHGTNHPARYPRSPRLLHVFLSELDLAPRVFGLSHGHLHHVLGPATDGKTWVSTMGKSWENPLQMEVYSWEFSRYF